MPGGDISLPKPLPITHNLICLLASTLSDSGISPPRLRVRLLNEVDMQTSLLEHHHKDRGAHRAFFALVCRSKFRHVRTGWIMGVSHPYLGSLGRIFSAPVGNLLSPGRLTNTVFVVFRWRIFVLLSLHFGRVLTLFTCQWKILEHVGHTTKFIKV